MSIDDLDLNMLKSLLAEKIIFSFYQIKVTLRLKTRPRQVCYAATFPQN